MDSTVKYKKEDDKETFELDLGGGIHAMFMKQLEISKLIAGSILQINEHIAQINEALRKTEEIKPIHYHRVEALKKIEEAKDYIRKALREVGGSDSVLIFEFDETLKKILAILA